MESRAGTTSTQHEPGSGAAAAHAALLFMAVIWAVNFSVAKVALATLSPLAFNALRFPLAGLALFILLRLRGTVPWPPRALWGRVFLLGLLGHLLYQQFFIFGLANSRAGVASVLLAGTPLITAILSARVGHERVKPRIWLGVAGSIIGIAMVVLFSRERAGPGEDTVLGALLLFAASIAWALYTVGSRNLVERYGALPVTAWTLWCGTLMIVLAGLPATLQVDLAKLSLEMWAAIVYAGVLSVGIAYAIWYYGVEKLGNTRTSTYSNLVPALTMIVAWLALGEVPAAGQIVGAAVIIAGVSLAQR